MFRVDSEMRSYPHIVRAAELVRNGRIGKVHTVTVGVPGSDVGCPPQPEMPVPPELDYELWQGPAPRAPYTEFRVHQAQSLRATRLDAAPVLLRRHDHQLDHAFERRGGVVCRLGADRAGRDRGHGEYPPPDSFWNVLLKFEVKMRFANGIQWTYRTEKPVLQDRGKRRMDFLGLCRAR